MFKREGLCKCRWYLRRPGSVHVAHVWASTKVRPDWARSQDCLTLSIPDEEGLTKEDGDEGGKDGVGQERPRGDACSQQVPDHLGSRRRSFLERVRRGTDLKVTRAQPPVHPSFHRRSTTRWTVCPSSCPQCTLSNPQQIASNHAQLAQSQPCNCKSTNYYALCCFYCSNIIIAFVLFR